LRLIQKDAIFYQALFPKGAAPLLTVRLRAEETIAKIQGVLNEKIVHLGRIEHHVKLYDFEDNFPNAVVEGDSFVIQEPQTEEVLEQRVSIEKSPTSGASVIMQGAKADPIVATSVGVELDLV
jgi:hypothetical protein